MEARERGASKSVFRLAFERNEFLGKAYQARRAQLVAICIKVISLLQLRVLSQSAYCEEVPLHARLLTENSLTISVTSTATSPPNINVFVLDDLAPAHAKV